MPWTTLACCGARADLPPGRVPEHLPGCPARGAEFRCSCHGPYCGPRCDGLWYLPDGRALTADEMRAEAGA